jgi:hypothetical protein
MVTSMFDREVFYRGDNNGVAHCADKTLDIWIIFDFLGWLASL